jgi:gluconate 2-dehydrogenase gamma chain
MGGQGVERREILRFIGIASVAGAFPGFSRWAFACAQEHVHAARVGADAVNMQGSRGPYKPQFFSAQQYRMIEHLVDIIIPADETPGAKEAGVAEFVDFMVANRVPVSTNREVRATQDALEIGTEAQRKFVSGLDWINAQTKSECGREFLECTAEQQKGLLEELAYKGKFKPGTETGQTFFRFLRDYTVVGYYTTRIGLESLGYPGLRSVWPAMPACSHPDDREHMHLPKPVV